MLAYAPRPERRRFHPATLALIIGAHAIALAAVMSARMDVVPDREPPIIVDTIPLPPEPAEAPPESTDLIPAPNPRFDNPPTPLPPLPLDRPIADPVPFPVPNPGPTFGTGTDPVPDPPIVRTGPRFATPPHLVKPPYPEERRRLDQEARLRLRLSIDANGRVVAVDPVGRTDPAFLEAARRHILRAWRYKPAMEGDKAVAASTVITLEFKLD